MAKHIWLGTKSHTRVDGEVIMPRQEFEPTDEEKRSFGDLMRISDKEVYQEDVVTSTPNPGIPDVPQKGMLHQPPVEADGTEPENMPKQVYHRMPPGQRVADDSDDSEGETSSRRPGRRAASADDDKK